MFSSINPGVLQVWMDEVNSGSPTLAEARERATLIISASAVSARPVLKWTNGDTDNLKYVNTSTPSGIAYLKVYTDNVNFGSSLVATDYLEIEPEFQLQFRGLQGV